MGYSPYLPCMFGSHSALLLADGEIALSSFWRSLHILSDFLIGICTAAISLTLLSLVGRAGHALPFRWVFVAFGAFIVSCGWTHFMHVAVVAVADNWGRLGVAQAVTVLAAGVTALLLPRVVPDILRYMETARKQVDLLELATDAIIVRDARNCMTFWNDSATQIYGCSRGEAIGQFPPAFPAA